MPIPVHAALRAELHCLSHDGREVRTAQHWVDPQAPASRPRSWLRLVVNGRPTQDAGFAGGPAQRELAEFWSSRVTAFGPTALTEDQMWVKLLELAGIIQSRCSLEGCSGVLPVAWWFCPVCSRDVRADRSALDVLEPRGRAAIVVDRRGPKPSS